MNLQVYAYIHTHACNNLINKSCYSTMQRLLIHVSYFLQNYHITNLMSLESNVGKISHHEFFISTRGTESSNSAACGEQPSQTAAPKQGCGHLCRVVVRKLHFADYVTLG